MTFTQESAMFYDLHGGGMEALGYGDAVRAKISCVTRKCLERIRRRCINYIVVQICRQCY